MPNYVSTGILVHGVNPLCDDYTLCGDGFEGEVGDMPECVVVPPQAITCPRCLEIIKCCVEYNKEAQADE